MIQTPLEHPLTTTGGTTVTILPYTLPLQAEGNWDLLRAWGRVWSKIICSLQNECGNAGLAEMGSTHLVLRSTKPALFQSVCLSLQAEPAPCSGALELILVAHPTPSVANLLRISCSSSAVDGMLWAFRVHVGEGGLGLWGKRESHNLCECSCTVRSPKQATQEGNGS